jgi:hypothetical protein
MSVTPKMDRLLNWVMVSGELPVKRELQTVFLDTVAGQAGIFCEWFNLQSIAAIQFALLLVNRRTFNF